MGYLDDGRVLAGLGLRGGFPTGASGWGDEINRALLTLSVLCQGNVISRTTALPSSGNAGDIYIVPAGSGSNANEVAVWDVDATETPAWVYFPPQAGWTLWDEGAGHFVTFNGTSWSKGAGQPFEITIALSPAGEVLAAGVGVENYRVPAGITLQDVRINIDDADDALVSIDVKKSGVSIFSALPSIDIGETTSVTAASPAAISDDDLPDDTEITFDIASAGTTGTNLKATLIGVRK